MTIKTDTLDLTDLTTLKSTGTSISLTNFSDNQYALFKKKKQLLVVINHQ